jgi:hypothetical protein
MSRTIEEILARLQAQAQELADLSKCIQKQHIEIKKTLLRVEDHIAAFDEFQKRVNGKKEQ